MSLSNRGLLLKVSLAEGLPHQHAVVSIVEVRHFVQAACTDVLWQTEGAVFHSLHGFLHHHLHASTTCGCVLIEGERGGGGRVIEMDKK